MSMSHRNVMGALSPKQLTYYWQWPLEVLKAILGLASRVKSRWGRVWSWLSPGAPPGPRLWAGVKLRDLAETRGWQIPQWSHYIVLISCWTRCGSGLSQDLKTDPPAPCSPAALNGGGGRVGLQFRRLIVWGSISWFSLFLVVVLDSCTFDVFKLMSLECAVLQ